MSRPEPSVRTAYWWYCSTPRPCRTCPTSLGDIQSDFGSLLCHRNGVGTGPGCVRPIWHGQWSGVSTAHVHGGPVSMSSPGAGGKWQGVRGGCLWWPFQRGIVPGTCQCPGLVRFCTVGEPGGSHRIGCRLGLCCRRSASLWSSPLSQPGNWRGGCRRRTFYGIHSGPPSEVRVSGMP